MIMMRRIPEDDSCDVCNSAIDDCCNKRPFLSYFIILSLWMTIVTSVIYSTRKSSRQICFGSLEQTDDVNAEIVLNYPIGESEQYLLPLGLGNHQEISRRFHHPVILTVTSQVLLKQTEILIQQVRKDVLPEFSQMQLVIFDMDLTIEQHEAVKIDCECDIRKFPNIFPDFVKNLIAVWQPLTIQLLLQDYSFVIWLDPDVHITNVTEIKKGIEIAKKTGIATAYREHLGNPVSLADKVNTETLKQLGEVQCAFNNINSLDTSLLLIHEDNSGYVTRYIMRPWVSCALTSGCMSSSSQPQSCSGTFEECNIAANSVLSIILHRIYHNDQSIHGKFPFDIS